MKCFLWVLLLSWSSLGHASRDCSTIDLSGAIGSNWDQMDTSWCHAFATTDSLTKHLQNRGVLAKGERLHPLQIAAASPLKNRESVIKSTNVSGTMIDDVVALSDAHYQADKRTPPVRINDGLCKESDLALEKNRAQALFNEDWRLAIRMFGEKDCRAGVTLRCASRDSLQDAQLLCSALVKSEGAYWSKLFKNKCKLPWPDWQTRYHYNPSRIEWISSGKKLEPFSSRIDKEMKIQIDKALESNELAAIGFDVSFLRKLPKAKPESHWTAVVGRHPGPDGQCIYVLKNSWGSDCGYYSSQIKCRGGTVEVPGDQLLPRVHTVQYFEN